MALGLALGWCSDGARISFLPPFCQFWRDLAEILFGLPNLLRDFDGINCFELAAFLNPCEMVGIGVVQRQ